MEAIPLHDSLHRFQPKRGCDTGILEAKLAQQLTFWEQSPLYGKFLDIRKTYNTIDRGRCIHILGNHGVREKAISLIQYFWEHVVLVCRAMRYYGYLIKIFRGVTQDGPVPHTIFNFMMNTVIREWK